MAWNRRRRGLGLRASSRPSAVRRVTARRRCRRWSASSISSITRGRPLPAQTAYSFEFRPPEDRPIGRGRTLFLSMLAAVGCVFRSVASIIGESGWSLFAARASSELTDSLGDSRASFDLIQAACWRGRLACMTKALSVDLRERVVGVIDGGLSRRQASARFGSASRARSGGMRWRDGRVLLRRSGRAATDAPGGSRSMPT